MLRKLKLPISVLICVACFATSPPPFAGECDLVDSIYAATRNDATRYDAIELLENIATRRFGLTDYAVLAKIGINIDISGGQKRSMGVEIVRVRALDKLGQSGLEMAANFLSGLTKENLGPDDTGQVWPAAQVALQRCLFARITDSQSKIDFLEATAKRFYGNVGFWATEELCNRGVQSSLPIIRSSIQRRNPSPDSDAEIEFCEARMEVLSKATNRVQALSAALHVGGGNSDPKLSRWAAYQLLELGSPEADRELDRFGREVAALSDNSPAKGRFSMLLKEIGMARRERGPQ